MITSTPCCSSFVSVPAKMSPLLMHRRVKRFPCEPFRKTLSVEFFSKDKQQLTNASQTSNDCPPRAGGENLGLAASNMPSGSVVVQIARWCAFLFRYNVMLREEALEESPRRACVIWRMSMLLVGFLNPLQFPLQGYDIFHSLSYSPY